MSTLARRDRNKLVDLHAQRDFLFQALDDLEAEHTAGELAEEDFATLRASYVERAAVTLRAIEAAAKSGQASVPDALLPRIRRRLGRARVRRVLLAVALFCAAGLALVVAMRLAGIRLPGQSATGSVKVPSQIEVSRELTQASQLAFQGQLVQAIAAYDAVLATVPDQPEALAYRGWLEREAGIAAKNRATFDAGDASIDRAVRVAPGYADAEAFSVIVSFVDKRSIAEGERAYHAFLADKPSRSLLSAIGTQMAAAFVSAHLPVPSGLSAVAPSGS